MSVHCAHCTKQRNQTFCYKYIHIGRLTATTTAADSTDTKISKSELLQMRILCGSRAAARHAMTNVQHLQYGKMHFYDLSKCAVAHKQINVPFFTSLAFYRMVKYTRMMNFHSSQQQTHFTSSTPALVTHLGNLKLSTLIILLGKQE